MFLSVDNDKENVSNIFLSLQVLINKSMEECSRCAVCSLQILDSSNMCPLLTRIFGAHRLHQAEGMYFLACTAKGKKWHWLQLK